MKCALVGAILVSISGAPLGAMLVLRRMSLMGDVMAHAILPGVALGFILAGASIPAMSFYGLLAGLAVALVAGVATRVTALREDASLTAFYLIAVALGVLLITMHGSAHDLEDLLFGDATTVDSHMLILMGVVTGLTILTLAVIYRPLIMESFDPVFMRSVHGRGGLYHIIFMILVVLNMVEGYRTLGTLMAAGLMLIPAIAAQFWTRRLFPMMVLAAAIAVVASAGGLSLTHRFSNVPSGPAIVLIVGLIYILSLIFGRYGSLRARYFPFRHLEI
jgi:zinc/manganese transport system permease protein